MKRILIIGIMACLAPVVAGQKSRVLAVMQMIDAGKYTEARETIELAVRHEKTSKWPRTYYTKGLLCQTAYEAGFAKGDVKKTNLYPDQLYVAYDAYEKALELDVRERIYPAVTQKYYALSNDFRKLGEKHYKLKEYNEALRAFEHALLVSKHRLIEAKTDTNLVYNTAMAAYKSEHWDKAIGYLTGLHEDAYSPNTTLLLHKAYMHTGDTLQAGKTLMEGLTLYHYEETVVMYLVNLLVTSGRYDRAIQIMDDAIRTHPDNYHFLWSRGLIYRRMGDMDKALESLQAAVELAPDQPKIYYHIGVCYYNLGVELREESLHIRDNDVYRIFRDRSMEQFHEAVKWLEHAYALDPSSEKTISKLSQLYYILQMKDKQQDMKRRMR